MGPGESFFENDRPVTELFMIHRTVGWGHRCGEF